MPPGPGDPAAGLEMFSPLYKKAQSYAMSLDVSDRSIAVDLVAAAGSAENAGSVAETLQAILTLGKNAVDGLRRDAPRAAGAEGEAKEWIVQAADSAPGQGPGRDDRGFVHLHADSAHRPRRRDATSWSRS